MTNLASGAGCMGRSRIRALRLAGRQPRRDVESDAVGVHVQMTPWLAGDAGHRRIWCPPPARVNRRRAIRCDGLVSGSLSHGRGKCGARL